MDQHSETTPGRRSFMQTMATVARGAAALVLAVPVLRFLASPLKGRKTDRKFIRVAELSSLPKDRPTRVVVNADRWDAYTHFPPGPIGSVWLVPAGLNAGTEESGPEIRCLQTICPHLGCGTDYAAKRGSFSCPCHTSDFDLAGRHVQGPSPRDLDELECRVTEPDAGGRRWVEVKFEKFQTGIATKRTMA